MTQTQSRSYTSNEVAPRTCRAKLFQTMRHEKRETDSRYEGYVVDDDDDPADVDGNGRGGYPVSALAVIGPGSNETASETDIISEDSSPFA